MTLANDFSVDAAFRETPTICIERPTGTGAAVEFMDQGQPRSAPRSGRASSRHSGFPAARGRGDAALGCGTWGRGRSGARPGASFGAIDVAVEALQEGGERGHPSAAA
ncbi:hypothetical protein [Streptomyces sp900116325]|uniref:hypothetical protein n=1 Tax=Streptomyces sp. 900116325 TaxID=3154295 RepID=UPI0033ACDA0F